MEALLWIAVGLLAVVVAGTTIYAKTNKGTINGLIWKDVGDVHRIINLRDRAKKVLSYYEHELQMKEDFPTIRHNVNINRIAKRWDWYIPADLHNKYFDEVQKLLDERGLDEKITLRTFTLSSSGTCLVMTMEKRLVLSVPYVTADSCTPMNLKLMRKS